MLPASKAEMNNPGSPHSMRSCIAVSYTHLTQQEIFDNMYNVDPATTGLCAYWKFNEGHGDIAEDYTCLLYTSYRY